MAIDTSTEVRALEAEQAKLARLHSRSAEAEERIRTLRARHETFERELGEAAVAGDNKRVGAIRTEMTKIKDDIAATEIEELALRKASAEQHARVRALQEPVKRMKVEAAFRAWLEFLPQLEAAVAAVDTVRPIAYELGFGDERTLDAFTGASLAWCPSSGRVAQWRTMTAELTTRLAKAGYRV